MDDALTIAEAQIAAIETGRLRNEQLDWFDWSLATGTAGDRVVVAQLKKDDAWPRPRLEFAPGAQSRWACDHCGVPVMLVEERLVHETADARAGFASCRSASRVWLRDPETGRGHWTWNEALGRSLLASASRAERKSAVLGRKAKRKSSKE